MGPKGARSRPPSCLAVGGRSSLRMLVTIRSSACGIILMVAGCTPDAASPPPILEVRIVEVLHRDVPITEDWVGTMDGSVHAEIRAQVHGYLIRQHYREGSTVKANDLLFEIDPRPFQATLDRARGELAQAQAEQGKAELDVRRLTPLAEKRAVSREELDDAVQSSLAAKGRVEALKAAVRQSELQLEFTQIRSPIDGVAGIARKQVGNLVGGSTSELLANVSTLDPIRVFFPVSESEFPRIMEALRVVDAHQQGAPGTLELILGDGTTYPHKGTLAATQLDVNPRTGSIQIVAAFPNPGNLLRPGMYGRVRAVVRQVRGALLVPQRAVSELQGEDRVSVLGSDDRVHFKKVKTGPRIGSLWLIEEGLEPGNRVLVDGIDRLKSGDMVRSKLVSVESLYETSATSTSTPLPGAQPPK